MLICSKENRCFESSFIPCNSALLPSAIKADNLKLSLFNSSRDIFCFVIVDSIVREHVLYDFAFRRFNTLFTAAVRFFTSRGRTRFSTPSKSSKTSLELTCEEPSGVRDIVESLFNLIRCDISISVATFLSLASLASPVLAFPPTMRDEPTSSPPPSMRPCSPFLERREMLETPDMILLTAF